MLTINKPDYHFAESRFDAGKNRPANAECRIDFDRDFSTLSWQTEERQ